MQKVNHILLVEDNPGDVLLIQEHLKESEFPLAISVASDGDEAVQCLKIMIEKNNLPHLIMLDLNLPKKNGIEVLQHIKSHDSLKPIPVIILTSSSLRDDIDRAYKHLANSYIVKPFDYDDFAITMQSLFKFWFATATLPNM